MAATAGSRGPGVWETDAPDGYIGIVVYDSAERLLMRLEIHDDVYRPDILPPLEQWVRDQTRVRLLPP